MTASLWNYLAGYVMIKIEGLALERLLNAALREGVQLCAVKRLSPTELVAKIRPKELSVLRGIRRKYACRIRIIKKSGAVSACGRLKTRKVLLFGWIPLLLAIFLLSRFVWIVQVTGCSDIPEEDVYTILDGMGIRPGISSKELDHYAISRALSAKDARIAWAGTSRKGVVLTVEIVEAEQIPQNFGEQEPCSLYAAKDGVIKTVTALKGRSVVAAGQTVKKGDLLITGELTSEAGIPHQVTARGEVAARVMYVVTADCASAAQIPARTGPGVPCSKVRLFGRELFPIPQEYADWEFAAEKSITLHSILPLCIQEGRLWQLTEQEIVLSRAEQESRARQLAEGKALSLLPKTARVVAKNCEIIALDDGSVRAVISIETEENIAVPGPLDVKNTETQDGA